MHILRLALLAVVRIAIFGALKLALYAYILTLPDTALAGAAAKRNGGIASYAAQGRNLQADAVQALQ